MSLRFEQSTLMKEKATIEKKDEASRTKHEKERLQEINDLLKKKIISVTMSQALVNRIDELVHETVGRSRAQLIEDAVRWFLDYSVHRWTDLGLYVSGSRVVLESETMNSFFFSKLTPSDQYELGITSGSQSAIGDVITLYHGTDPTEKESRGLILTLLQSFGWGFLKMQSSNLLVITSPFYPAPFIQGYLEALLKVKLELVDTAGKDTAAFRFK
ncbi:MAG: ribbon-helix-helix domain-containing protein [Candidatus Thorarchaeota archaeon]